MGCRRRAVHVTGGRANEVLPAQRAPSSRIASRIASGRICRLTAVVVSVWWSLRSQGINEDLLAAFVSIPRHFFLPDFVRAQAYDDMPVAIGCGQTISQPSLVLRMIALLDAARAISAGCRFWIRFCVVVTVPLTYISGLVHAVEFESSLIEGSRGGSWLGCRA